MNPQGASEGGGFRLQVGTGSTKLSSPELCKIFGAHETVHGAKARNSHLSSCFCESLYWHCKFGGAYGGSLLSVSALKSNSEKLIRPGF